MIHGNDLFYTAGARFAPEADLWLASKSLEARLARPIERAHPALLIRHWAMELRFRQQKPPAVFEWAFGWRIPVNQNLIYIANYLIITTVGPKLCGPHGGIDV